MRKLQRILYPILYPLSWIYGGIAALRNLLFSQGIFRSVEFDVFTVVVGNLCAGGSGKTPMVKWITHKILERNLVPGIISRGYGRATRGIYSVTDRMTSVDVGDEPLMYHQTFGNQVEVVVGEQRVLAIPFLLNEAPQTEVLVLDDAYQHRQVKRHLNILLTDFAHLFSRDHVLPAGMLREFKQGANRADIVVVTKCPPDLDMSVQEHITQELSAYLKDSVSVYFTTVNYGKPVGNILNDRPVIGLSGIAQNNVFEGYLSQFDLKKHFSFSDHHAFTLSEIEQIKQYVASHPNAVIVTTEKDFMRLQEEDLKAALEGVPLCYIPIDISFLWGEDRFLKELFNHINAHQRA